MILNKWLIIIFLHVVKLLWFNHVLLISMLMFWSYDKCANVKCCGNQNSTVSHILFLWKLLFTECAVGIDLIAILRIDYWDCHQHCFICKFFWPFNVENTDKINCFFFSAKRFKTHYEVLGVSKHASEKEIRNAFLTLTKQVQSFFAVLFTV